MRNKPDCAVLTLNYWDLVKNKLSSVLDDTPEFIPGHAGDFETSLQLFLSNHLVESSQVSKSELNSRISLSLSGNNTYLYQPFKSLSSNGQLGNSYYGSKEKGKIILEMIIKELKKAIINFSNWDIGNCNQNLFDS